MLARVTAVPEPIRILRVIARLNMGGPAIHVASLAAGLETRGYHTTLVAGSLARGEDSMAYVAERLGVDVVDVPEIQREVALLHDVKSVRRLTAIMREERPHILHTHTAKAGALARAAAVAAGRATAADHRPHVPRARPQGLLRPRSHRVLPAGRAHARATVRRPDRGEPGGARRARRARRRAERQVRGHPPRDPARRAARRRDGRSRLPAPVRHLRTTRSSSAGSGA